jgi:DnaJ-class molecular chaperone
MKKIDKDGKIPCPRCNGSGCIKNPKYIKTENKLLRAPLFLLCPKCNGRKKMTWLEDIFGKKSDPI